MKSLPFILSFALCVVISRCAVRAQNLVPQKTALDAAKVRVVATGIARDQLALTFQNESPEPATIAVPAGLIATGSAPETRVIVLRAATATVPGKSATEVLLPVAALSSRPTALSQNFTFTDNTEPRLTALLAALADQPDMPRATAQLAVFCLLENITFAAWRTFLGSAAETTPTPAEVTQAIDALGLLRAIAPTQPLALAADADLKARALRNPWCRAKAMAIYGLDFGDGAVPPDLRQLLHTQAGDNCPICRQRGLMPGRADAP